MRTILTQKNSPILLFCLILLIFSVGLLGYLLITSDRADVTLTWKTASELNTAGFNIYRGESGEEVTQRLNQTTIPPADDSFRGAEYKYVDHNAKPNTQYYYKIEEIELSGKSNFYGPIEHTAKGTGNLEYALVILLSVVSLAGMLFLFYDRRR